jgi:hypothetical protein
MIIQMPEKQKNINRKIFGDGHAKRVAGMMGDGHAFCVAGMMGEVLSIAKNENTLIPITPQATPFAWQAVIIPHYPRCANGATIPHHPQNFKSY